MDGCGFKSLESVDEAYVRAGNMDGRHLVVYWQAYGRRVKTFVPKVAGRRPPDMA